VVVKEYWVGERTATKLRMRQLSTGEIKLDIWVIMTANHWRFLGGTIRRGDPLSTV